MPDRVSPGPLLLARSFYTDTVGVVPNSLQDIGRASDGAERRPVAGDLILLYGIYTLARVSWRFDSLVSRHRRVTQNS